MTTIERLRAAHEAAEAVTPGPWRLSHEIAKAEAIVLAHNALPALLDIAEAARTIVDGGWVDTDGETGDQWCHWCEAMDGHHEGCWFVDLRAALDRLEEVGS
jgi:hypothetical protein